MIVIEAQWTRTRKDGLLIVVLSVFGFLALIGLMLFVERGEAPLIDFRTAYTTARSVLLHRDPYDPASLVNTFQQINGAIANDSFGIYIRDVAMKYFYVPTVFSVTLPFAVLPFKAAQILWVVCVVVCCVIAAGLAWELAGDCAPILAGVLLGFCLVNSISSVFWGNPAGIAVGLCVIAVWCFLRNRFVAAGILCMAASLALKPNDPALLWLYFLVAGSACRKRALQSLAVLIACSLPAIVWVWHISPHWVQEMHSNYIALSARGAVSDPGPSVALERGACMLTDLRSVFSFIWDDPRFYNLASYAVGAILLLVWLREIRRTRLTPERTLFLIAAVAAFSSLPTYHRLYDARLIVLTVPALAALWSRGGWIARIAFVINGAAIVATADLPWVLYLSWAARHRPAATSLAHQLQVAAISFPVPITLLATATFYLWVSSRDGRDTVAQHLTPAAASQ